MITQLFIVLFGVSAVMLTQQKNESLKKYACILGVLSQPFWFYTAWHGQQWGIFVLSIIYSGGWLLGVKNYWLTKPKQQEPQDHCECEALKPTSQQYCSECENYPLLNELETIRRKEMKNKATRNRVVFVKREGHVVR